MNLTPVEFQKRLFAISSSNGRLFGRAFRLLNAEERFGRKCSQYKGYFALSDAFKCLYIETIEILNTECLPKSKSPLSEPYSLFVPSVVYNFKTLCGAERLALHGYPNHACTLLRNSFDNLVLISAAIQKITDFGSIEGVIAEKQLDISDAKKLRKKTEFTVRQKMTGIKSGLSQKTIEELAKLDYLFDYEVHGGGMSHVRDIGWLKGLEPLPIFPEFREQEFAMFMNRYCEVAWILHRLFPLMQCEEILFGEKWNMKWQTIDYSFRVMEEGLTSQAGKAIGIAYVEFVEAKFPFGTSSYFS